MKRETERKVSRKREEWNICIKPIKRQSMKGIIKICVFSRLCRDGGRGGTKTEKRNDREKRTEEKEESGSRSDAENMYET